MNVRTEEATQGIDGIKRIQSTASEGMDTVMIKLDLGADARRVVDKVKSNIDAITTFPFQTEKPIIRELTNRAQVVNIAVSGDVDPVHAEAGHGTRERRRRNEISIEVSEDDRRRHGMTVRPGGRRRTPLVAGPAGTGRCGTERGRSCCGRSGRRTAGGVRGSGAVDASGRGAGCGSATWRP